MSAAQDMLAAIEGAKAALSGQSWEDFQQSWVLRHAVQRALEIISEAARQLPNDLTSAYPDVPWSDIRGIGNVLRHDYHNVSDGVVWNVVLTQFDRLEAALCGIITKLSSNF